MPAIFLSASIPTTGRKDFYETANPFLIQFAVRELLTVCLGRRRIVWGGHPAITPMVWSVCEGLGVKYATAVTLVQTKLFEEQFPEENRHFDNVEFVEAVGTDREASLRVMRKQMFSRSFAAGVFIGGMEGIFDEYELFRQMHPHAKIVAVAAPGGAALQLAEKLGNAIDRIDFARYFYEQLGVDARELRDQLSLKNK